MIFISVRLEMDRFFYFRFDFSVFLFFAHP